jgi:hypothetical protein
MLTGSEKPSNDIPSMLADTIELIDQHSCVSVRSDHLENGLQARDARSQDRCDRVREETDGEFENGSGWRSIGEWSG